MARKPGTAKAKIWSVRTTRIPIATYPAKTAAAMRTIGMSQIYTAFPRRALAGALQAARAVLLVRNALFLAARFGYQTVPDLFPNGPVLFQVDLNGYFAALLIHNEADS